MSFVHTIFPYSRILDYEMDRFNFSTLSQSKCVKKMVRSSEKLFQKTLPSCDEKNSLLIMSVWKTFDDKGDKKESKVLRRELKQTILLLNTLRCFVRCFVGDLYNLECYVIRNAR